MATLSDGRNYRLTKHGRRRFIERIGRGFTDLQILQFCYDGCPGTDWKPVWKPEWNLQHPTGPKIIGHRLVTLIPKGIEEY